MRARIVASWLAFAAIGGGHAACGLVFPTKESDAPGVDGGGEAMAAGDAPVGQDAGASGDGTADAMADGGDGGVAAKDFSISVSPAYVPLAASQSTTVTVSVQRIGGFGGEVDVFMTPPAYVSANSSTIIPAGSTTSTFTLTAAAALPATALGDFTVTIAGRDPTGTESAMTPLTVHLSGKLATFSSGTTMFAVPSNISLLRIKAWGAGGGSGCNGGNGGGGGGAGGFVLADAVVVPNEMLGIDVGASEASGCSGASTGGGGGSAVLRGSTRLVVAGGGGGGGEGCSALGGTGGGGGGVMGRSGPGGSCDAVGGGGASQMGDGTSVGIGAGGGGGGGGLHDGGRGGSDGMNTCGCPGSGGGGGGSGGSDALDAGVSIDANLAGSTMPPNTTDPDYAPNAGVPAGPTLNSQQQAGNAGRIVLIVP